MLILKYIVLVIRLGHMKGYTKFGVFIDGQIPLQDTPKDGEIVYIVSLNGMKVLECEWTSTFLNKEIFSRFLACFARSE